jgi:hypothetical protein
MVLALVCIAVAGVALAWVLDRDGQTARPMTTFAATTAEPTTPEEACSNLETYWTPLCQGDGDDEYEPEPCKARCQEAARRKPQRSNESCLYRHGKIRWCLTAPRGEEWYIDQRDVRVHRGHYFLHNHQEEIQGYLRPTAYGWRAMFLTSKGWVRGGKVVRTGQRNVLDVYSEGKGFTARGALAVEVAAYKLIYGDCTMPWTDEPCRNGVGQ